MYASKNTKLYALFDTVRKEYDTQDYRRGGSRVKRRYFDSLQSAVRSIKQQWSKDFQKNFKIHEFSVIKTPLEWDNLGEPDDE